jgi:dolichol-phosphate mannosyltransferase
MKTFVVLPTYNERENIVPMLDALTALDVPTLSVLVVDDSSPDGTADLVREYGKNTPRVSLFSRPQKEGLGRAYIAGFQEAIGRGAETIIQMDADFSHDPNDVPRLLWHLQRSDLVIGSRYLHGGNIANWSRSRRFLSRYANVYARVVTGVPVSDLTGGFKAWRRALLERVDIPTIAADGYGFQIEMNVRAWRSGARVTEIPIVFEDRRAGVSKMTPGIIREAAFLVWKLRFQRAPLHAGINGKNRPAE